MIPHVHIWDDSPGELEAEFLVFINHGVAEHAGRYAEVARVFNAMGGRVIAQDHRGHGKTAEAEGLALGKFVEKDPLAVIITDAVNVILKHNPKHLPWILFGHSMGALISQYVLQELQGHYLMKSFKGLILSGPAMPLANEQIEGFKEFLKGLFGTDSGKDVLRELCFVNFDKVTREICQDENLPRHCWISEDLATVREFCEDPLCDQDFPAEFWYSLMTHVAALPSLNFRFVIKAPVLIFGGDMDAITQQGLSLDVVRNRLKPHINASCIELLLIPGRRHELMKGPGKELVFKKLTAWTKIALE